MNRNVLPVDLLSSGPLQSCMVGSHLLPLILDGCTEGFILLDAVGGVYYWNSWMANITGVHSQDILGKRLVEIFPQIAGTRLARAIDNVLRSGMASVLSRTLNPRLFPLFRGTVPLEQTVYISAITTPDGRRWGVIRIADLTPAVEREKFLQGQARELSAARDSAEAANKARGEFLAHISHEIRTPMNGVLGFAEMLRETPLTDRQRRWVDTILGSGQLLLGLLNSVLDLAKIESGKFELTPRLFNLREEVEETLEIFGIRAQGKGVEIVGIVGEELPAQFIGDGNRLRQILQNLISNAVKFTEHGEVILRVELVESDHRSALLGFTVSDTGIGFTPEQVGRLFKPFSQAEESIGIKFGGTGLGLSISRRLVELMGGTIWAEPREQGGAEFHFTARFGFPTPEEEQDGEIDEGCEPLSGAGSELAKVVVAVSHGATRDALGHELRLLGLDVTPFAEVGDLLKRPVSPETLVFLDAAWMNDLGDLRTFAGKCVCLLPLTALGAPVRPGVVGELTKPVRRRALRRCLHAVLSGKTFFGTGVSAVASSPTPLPSGMSILVVEDQPINSEVAVAMLTSLGHRAESALSAQEGLERLRCRDFDLVLMDLQMPEIDGMQATRLIRDPASGVRNPRIPIVALTAMAMVETSTQCVAAGMDGYLTKPLRRSDLTQILSRYAGAAWNAGTASTAPVEAVSPAESIPLFAASELFHRLGESRSLVQKIIETFLEQFPLQIADLQQSVPRGNGEEIKRQAHSMKGMTANLAARRLSAQCAELETAAGKNDLRGCERILEQLLTTWNLLGPAMRTFLEKNVDGQEERQ